MVEAEGEDGPRVSLRSQEGELFELEVKAAELSKLVKTMLPDESPEADGEETEVGEIPCPNVKSATLSKVVEFCRRYSEQPMPEIEMPLKSSDMNEVMTDPWYAAFVDMDNDNLFELMQAANYMDIKPLLDLICARIAASLKDKTAEEIRKTFNIVNDFTPEEEASIFYKEDI